MAGAALCGHETMQHGGDRSGATGETLRGELRRNEPMSRHTSWRVGGPADLFYTPADLDDLAAFLRWLPAAVPVVWLGLGSNLLVRDGGVRGAVLCTHKGLRSLRRVNGAVLYVEAGIPCAKVARYCVTHDLTGAEFMAGIPGTVGGALAMNAGAFGTETWEIVHAVHTVDREGYQRKRFAGDFQVGYRTVHVPRGEWFVAAELRLGRGHGPDARARIRGFLARRGETQPTRVPNAGSVFRNPPGDHAARLIESAGLKGTCEGAACVSRLHANFIENRGGATAAQIERLIARVRDGVESVHGIRLEPEVRIIGEPRQE